MRARAVFTQGRNRVVQLSAPGPAGWLVVIAPAADEDGASKALDQLVAFARKRYPDPSDWEKARAAVDMLREPTRYRMVEQHQCAQCGEMVDQLQTGSECRQCVQKTLADEMEAIRLAAAKLYAESVPSGDWERLGPTHRASWISRAAHRAAEAKNKNRRPDEEEPPNP